MGYGNIASDVTQQTSLAIRNQLNRLGNVEWRWDVHGACPQPGRFDGIKNMQGSSRRTGNFVE
jgi:hypothetical protein